MQTEAYLHAIRLLTKRNYSRAKLTHKLEEKAYPQEDIIQAVDQVVAKNFLKEDDYIESRIVNFLRRGDSPSRILQKLRAEGCHANPQLVEEMSQEYGINTTSQLEELIHKKLRHHGPDKWEEKRPKILNFLLSKGHSLEDSRQALSRYIDSRSQ